MPHILVVEDDPDVGDLISLMLQQAGHSVDVARDGSSALRLLADTRYAAMTLDLMLPDHNALDLMRRIRANPGAEALPVVVVSGCAEEGEIALGGEFSAIEWLQKPVSPEQLVQTITRAMAAAEAG